MLTAAELRDIMRWLQSLGSSHANDLTDEAAAELEALITRVGQAMFIMSAMGM